MALPVVALRVLQQLITRTCLFVSAPGVWASGVRALSWATGARRASSCNYSQGSPPPQEENEDYFDIPDVPQQPNAPQVDAGKNASAMGTAGRAALMCSVQWVLHLVRAAASSAKRLMLAQPS
jgi:hypothetical protein